ncbi:MAG: 50S ribosomal protein L9 [Sphingomonadaceae bacterium]|nr:50S ribosomal protein L9 [Sphingomonadaceae bacterium]
MEVILLERVEKLGQIGDVVTVKNGFARNYLLPRNKALRANEANRKLFEANKAKIVADNDAKRKDAEAASKGIDGASVTLIRQASNTGQLYGSVAVRDIVEALVADGKKVSKQQVVLDKPIKAIGVYDVKVSLDLQSQGVDILAQMFEKDVAGFTEDFDPNAEPGTIAEEAPAEAATADEGEDA